MGASFSWPRSPPRRVGSAATCATEATALLHQSLSSIAVAPNQSLQLSLQHGRVVVRTGGGFLKLDEFLKRYLRCADGLTGAAASEAHRRAESGLQVIVGESVSGGAGRPHLATVVRKGTQVMLADAGALSAPAR